MDILKVVMHKGDIAEAKDLTEEEKFLLTLLHFSKSFEFGFKDIEEHFSGLKDYAVKPSKELTGEVSFDLNRFAFYISDYFSSRRVVNKEKETTYKASLLTAKTSKDSVIKRELAKKISEGVYNHLISTNFEGCEIQSEIISGKTPSEPDKVCFSIQFNIIPNNLAF